MQNMEGCRKVELGIVFCFCQADSVVPKRLYQGGCGACLVKPAT
jgi:hypothetical protein